MENALIGLVMIVYNHRELPERAGNHHLSIVDNAWEG